MIPSPAKRRKSNSSTAIPILEPSDGGQASSYPDDRTRPSNRASFLSPTKASTARSHPELLSRVLGRSAAERTQRSEDRAIELQKGETEETARIRAKRSTSQSINDGANRSATETADAPDARKEPEADSKAPPPSKVDNGGTRRSTRRALFSSRLPLARSQVSASSALPDVVSIAARTQVREEVLEAQKAEDDEGEPELPPTPTQLGLQTLSLRSRVLMSSSPSLRLDQRKRRASQQQYVSSPLKPHDEQPVQVQVEDEEAGVSVAPPEEKVPKELLEKRKLRDELAAQLARLKEETASLEDFSQRLEQSDEYGPLDEISIKRLLRLLTTDNPSCAPLPKPRPQPSISSMLSHLLPFSAPKHIPKLEPQRPVTPTPENPFALEQPSDPLPYLTLFAPLSLTTNTTASSISSSDPSQPSRLIQKHEFVLSPPPEFSQSIYRVPIRVATDPEQQTVLSISIPSPSQSLEFAPIPTQLRTWMDTRLSNPLLKLDISGLSWGVCRYWEACVSRARLWIRLQNLHSQLSKSSRAASEGPESKKYTARVLIPHLDQSHFFISGPQSAQKYEILVSCPIEIDLWTSEPYLQPEISLSIPESAGAGGATVEKEARRVFWNMLKHGGAEVEVDCDAIVRAVEAVVGVLYGERG